MIWTKKYPITITTCILNICSKTNMLRTINLRYTTIAQNLFAYTMDTKTCNLLFLMSSYVSCMIYMLVLCLVILMIDEINLFLCYALWENKLEKKRSKEKILTNFNLHVYFHTTTSLKLHRYIFENGLFLSLSL